MSTDTQSVVAGDVKEFIDGMLGSRIELGGSDPAQAFSIAEYVSEDGAVLGYVATDLAGGCRLGAALTHIPGGRADEAAAEGVIADSLRENLYEILNVGMNLVRAADGSRVLLGRIAHGSSEEHFDELSAGLEGSEREDVLFELPRYGACTISVGKVSA